MNQKTTAILTVIQNLGEASSSEIHQRLTLDISYATVKRALTQLIDEQLVSVEGKGKARKYKLSMLYDLLTPINMHQYYQKEIDERSIKEGFNFSLIREVLSKHSVFSYQEFSHLQSLQQRFEVKVKQLRVNEYKKEFERLAIDLSWKSSQIEGNTYSLLETERLFKEKETATGKTKEEAIMLLNHKEALDFILDNPDYLSPLSQAKIEDIHSILTKDLDVARNIRKRPVGISGTNFQPLDNEFQIQEALHATCELINTKSNAFEKALLALVLISYIQPFMDGNKRTARIVSNALLMSASHCPLSFRTVDSMEYKKAMLLFYEQNNIQAFKNIFIEQVEFAIKTYF